MFEPVDAGSQDPEIAHEQAVVDATYHRLDQLKDEYRLAASMVSATLRDSQNVTCSQHTFLTCVSASIRWRTAWCSAGSTWKMISLIMWVASASQLPRANPC